MNASPRTFVHQPVMVQEVLAALAVEPGGKYIDCTLGTAGHAIAILGAKEDVQLLGIDADSTAVKASIARLTPFGQASRVVHSNFSDLENIARSNQFFPAQGVLFDLGLSSDQLENEHRGFSFFSDDPLDMRFDPTKGVPASEMVNNIDERQLANLIFEYGEEPRSRRIAKAIIRNRPINSARQLADIIGRTAGYRRGRTHPATRTFQAIRIAVNQELDNLVKVLSQAANVLDLGGRLVTIAYHSLEDRIIKRFLTDNQSFAPEAGIRPLSKKVIRPTFEEVKTNRRSRSARLRIGERI
jgi:16S rRNA (cytosine1402-N4)-methyltransferase